MAVATFDGPNLTITLPSGQISVDLEKEVYSAWKQWALLNDNSKFPPAFRSAGGDPLVTGIEAGAYFFLNNVDGWRIKPPEENITILLSGNLAPEDSTRDMIIPTTGAFTALVVNLQPVTQNVDSILTQTQANEYNGMVVYDAIAGVAGTEHPVGTHGTPVNNLTDAKAIIAAIGAHTLEVSGLLTLDQDLTKIRIKGATNSRLDRLSLATFDVDEALIQDLEVAGTGQGTVEMVRCNLDNIDGMVGTFRDCGLMNNVSLPAGTSYFIDCFSEVQGNTKPTLNCTNALVSVGFRRYTGGLSVLNFSNAGNTASFDLVAADLLLNASVSAGDIVVRGVGTLTNNTTGTATVVKNGFVDGLDVKLIKALDAGNVTITGSNPFVVQVLDPDDNVTVIAEFNVSADGRTRTRTV
jgi:hypothetical protein